LHKTRRLLYTEKLNKLKERLEIKKIEKELVNFSSKTCDFEKFKLYVTKKLEILKELKRLYNLENTFYKMKRFGYINKKRENDRLINTIKKEFGEDVILIYGDWSNKMAIKGISTPNNEIKKLLTSNFITLEIDEYKTSKIHYKTGVVTENYVRKFNEKYLNKKLKEKINVIKEKNENLYIKITKNYKLYSVLVYKETVELDKKKIVKSSGCINRDTNATLNMKAIVENYLRGGGRLKQFRR
jgi:hypothetical protein